MEIESTDLHHEEPALLVEEASLREENARLQVLVDRWMVRTNVATLLGVAAVYFLVCIPLNLTGTKDPHMLLAINIDEYTSYPVVQRMISGGETIKEAVTNFFFYDYQYYGYFFFFVYGLAVLPVKALLAYGLIDDVNAATAYMFVLRQLNVVFIEAAILILVYLWTGFRSLVRSLFLFLLLAAIPPLFNLNLVFHPDHLTLLLVVLTLYALNRDGLRFGKWYYLAAVFCGAATGTKYAGLYFFLTVLVYLLLGLYHRQTDVVGFVKHGFGFLVTKVAAVIATNPLLLRPDQFKVY